MRFHTDLHAPRGVPQAGVRPHLDGPVGQLLPQLQHSAVVGHGLVEVPLRVVGAAQVAVRPRLLAAVFQTLPQVTLVKTKQE